MNAIDDLTAVLKKIPGLGNKSARRIVFYLLKQDEQELKELGNLISGLKDNLKTCSICGNISENNPCAICSDTLRDSKVLCLVEDIETLTAFEQAGIYNGHYHVLGTHVSPLRGQEVDEDSIKFLLKHIKKLKPSEIILATSPNIEGDMTQYYLLEALKSLKHVKVTRLAFGLPLGGSIEFADRLTLHTSLEARRPIN